MLKAFDDTTGLLRTTATELRAAGRAARTSVPRSAHGSVTLPERDPVAIVAAQNEGRVPWLVPLRIERMTANPFAFYRGTAGLMAHDLRAQATTDVHVVLCGDAHLGNFGFYASPERRLVFDLNDFDEAAAGPWEWDVKRLVTSVVLGGRARGFRPDRIRMSALQAAQSYRSGLARLLSLDALSRYYTSIDEKAIGENLPRSARTTFEAAARKASTRTSSQVIDKLMSHDEAGRLRFVETPPVLTHLPDAKEELVEELFERYRATVRPDIALLLSKHSLTDVARRVVGVGSVGTRCYLLALSGPDGGSLVLQAKEALPSVITAHNTANATTPATVPADAQDGQRIVAHQQILQGVSDPFLGYLDIDGRHYYVRQFRDMKGSVDLDRIAPKPFTQYVAGCGLLLARAHSQSPAAHWISGYLGSSDAFDKAVVSWALGYADRVASDHAALVSAASGAMGAPSEG